MRRNNVTLSMSRDRKIYWDQGVLTCSNRKYGLATQVACAGLALLSPFPSLC